MEQRDLLLREIEKIGMVLKGLLNKIAGNNDNLAIKIEYLIKETRDSIFKVSDFNLIDLIEKEPCDIHANFKNINGFNLENLEILANLLEQLGMNNNSEIQYKLLEKSLLLYEYCKKNDKTYSFERENRIMRIHSLIGNECKN